MFAHDGKMSIRTLLLAGCIFLTTAPFAQFTADQPGVWSPRVDTDFDFESIFPRKRLTGRTASQMEWSHDDRFLAYLWNPIDDPGNDLWVYDTRSGKSERVTSTEVMRAFDRAMPRIIEHHTKELEEIERTVAMSLDDFRKWQLQRREEREKRTEPLPTYPGIAEFTWAEKSHELVFVYRGDLFRWKPGDKAPQRLTRTQADETQPEFAEGDQALYYRSGGGVFRMRFDEPFPEQLNPPLPNNLPLHSYNISPDGRRLLVQTSRRTAPSDQVDYIVYRERFAQARRTERDVADDPFRYEAFLFMVDVPTDPKDEPKAEEKPWEVWKFEGGMTLISISLHDDPWSSDSKRFVFTIFNRDTKELQVVEADVAKRTTRVIHKTISDGEHTTPGMAEPFYTPDDSKVITLLDTSGFRHAWVVDPLMGGATQLTRGEIELYPLEMRKDGKTLFVRGQGEHPARYDIYAVDMATGVHRRLSSRFGDYGVPVISHSQRHAAATFRNWERRTEMYILNLEKPGEVKAVTDSHRPGDEWERLVRIRPTLFQYQNRHGHTIHGYKFLPPNFRKEDRRPLFINVYGGPLGMGKSVNVGSMGLFDIWLAYALGYVVVTIDPRGQSGYGNLFGKANWERPGMPQTEDLTDGVRFLAENFGIDTDRVAISGWSFGGFQAIHSMLHEPDVFTLGIAGAGPTEWQNYNNWYSGGVIGRSRQGKPEDLDRFSLTHRAQYLRNPLLLLHGKEDLNVLYQDSVALYRQFLQHGKGPLVEFVPDPTGGHGLGGDITGRDQQAIYVAFLLKHWGPWRPPAR